MKAKAKIICFSILFFISICYFKQNVNAETEAKHTTTVTLDYKDFLFGNSSLDNIIKSEISYAIDWDNYSDIIILDKKVKERKLDISFYAKTNDPEDIDYCFVRGVSFAGDFEGDALNQKIVEELKNNYEEIEEVTNIKNIEIRSISYEVTYILDNSVGQMLDLPRTDEDGIAVLSPITFYIQGYRVPYILEDGGEYYIPCDYFESPAAIYGEPCNIINTNKDFLNYEWKSPLESGTEIGKVLRSPRGTIYDLSHKYDIANEDYFKLSELLDDNWRTKNALTYEKENSILYYGTKPSKKEWILQDDTIYTFTMNAIKGCKTEKEKLTAIHDAIIKKCSFDSKTNYFDHTTVLKGPVKEMDTYIAQSTLKYGKGDAESLTILFMECCKHIFSPCDIINGDYGVLWCRVYLNNEHYNVDIAADSELTSNKHTISHKFCVKSNYYFMGTHWNDLDDDFQLETFSKSWRNIDRNNIRTTQDLRRAVAYASYLCGDNRVQTYTFHIKSKKVQIDCEACTFRYRFVHNVNEKYKDGVLTVTFN